MDEQLLVAMIAGFFGLVGGSLAYFASLFLEKRKFTMAYNLKIFDVYDKITSDILNIVSEISSLTFKAKISTKDDMEKVRASISDLYFKYYNYLPKDVLNEMNCLHLCLQGGGKNIYALKNNSIVKCSDSDVFKLLDNTVIISSFNESRIKNFFENNTIDKVPASIKINLQARRVITVMNIYFGHENLHLWTTQLKKETRSKKK